MKTGMLTQFNQTPSRSVPAMLGSAFILTALILIVTVHFNSLPALGDVPILRPHESGRVPVKKRQVVGKRKSKKAKKVEDLPNFHKVHAYLYRGGEPSDSGVKKLKEMGIKTLIDLRAPTEMAKNEKRLAGDLGLTYINLPMSDKPPTQKQVDTLLTTIDRAKRSGDPVFVHCAHGSDRTGCMIGIWRVTRDGWGFDNTYKEMRKYYFGKKYTRLRNAVKKRVNKSR